MSIRRKSTTHDLATLRLHPDGSRVQQCSLNVMRRTARTTAIDSRGNWIAKDAGGKGLVRKRRRISRSHMDDADGELICLSGDEEHPSQSKGKQQAHDDQTPEEDEPEEPDSIQLNTRTRQRLSFLRDLSFLDPSPVSVSSLEQDIDATSAGESFVSFPDPAPDLLKAIHHFTSCYYLERGQLSDSSRDYRGEKNERRKQRQDNIHTLAANALEHQDRDSESEYSESEEQVTEDNDDGNETADAEDSGREPTNKADPYAKDMYKAFDGSALMAIGIVLQEYVAHTLLSRSRTSEGPRGTKRRAQ